MVRAPSEAAFPGSPNAPPYRPWRTCTCFHQRTGTTWRGDVTGMEIWWRYEMITALGGGLSYCGTGGAWLVPGIGTALNSLLRTLGRRLAVMCSRPSGDSAATTGEMTMDTQLPGSAQPFAASP